MRPSAPLNDILVRLRHNIASCSWIILPVIFHFGFSWIGFNPTDDGWLQSVARRMLDGEIPHRDFIFVRPAFSAVLQIPIVLFGGDYTVWISRLWGWLEIGGITWIWSGLACRTTSISVLRVMLYALAFILTAHSFPVMAWHTLDAMLIASIAIHQATHGALRSAFFLAGLSCLCRQNFCLFPPLLFFAIPDLRRWHTVWWAAVPAMVYLIGLTGLGALRDFLLQITTSGELVRVVALERYQNDTGFLWGLAIGALITALLTKLRTYRPMTVSSCSLVAFFCLSGLGALSLALNPAFFSKYSFLLFGVALGLVLVLSLCRNLWKSDDRMVFSSGLALSWISAISIGYNTPALASGVLILLLWRGLGLYAAEGKTFWTARILTAAAGLFFCLGGIVCVRLNFPYRDRPAGELKYSAGEALPGAKGLRTGDLTFRMLVELKQVISTCQDCNQTYAILTDCSAAWIQSKQSNPLPCEWPQRTELGNSPMLIDRMITSIQELPPDSRIIVQNCLITDLSREIRPIPENWTYFAIQNWVQKNWYKVESREFFDVYKSAEVVGR